MNDKALQFLKNFSYTLTSNIIALLISILVVMIVPKALGVEEYGYWQLYLFYSSYVGFMHFGWSDGIYLRYGGKKYEDLDKKMFFSQIHMLIILQLIIGAMVLFGSILLIEDENKVFILQMTTLCMIIANARSIPFFILQATNRIKEYAKITIVEKVVYFTIMIFLLGIGIRDYKILIQADIIGRFFSLIYVSFACRDIIFNRLTFFSFTFKEAFQNIIVGIRLMFANIASMLIIGIVRFGIERSWDIGTFGKVSLTLSLSKLLMVFINAVGIIMFPVLRRTNADKLPTIYITLRNTLTVILLGVLLVFYPLKYFLSIWLPEYKDSLLYMALLFPMSIYEGKMALLINTYLKTLRKEKIILRINLVTVILSGLVTMFTTIVIKDLSLAVFSIIVLLAIRSLLAELYLSKLLKVEISKDIILESVVVLIFIVINWYLNAYYPFLLYLVIYLAYIYIKKNDILLSFKEIQFLIAKR